MTSPTVLDAPVDTRTAARRAFVLVFSCTVIGALAQILIKQGTLQLGAHVTLGDLGRDPRLFVTFCLGVMKNLKLFFGYCLLGVNTVLMALALKGQELSRLYPVIALTYVWVTILSLFLLPDEHLNLFRTVGIAFIVGGVSILGLRK